MVVFKRLVAASVWFFGASVIGQTIQEDMRLVAEEVAEEDYFGFDIDICGTTAIIGAPSDYAKIFNSGHAYLYNIETGEQLRQLVGQDVWANAWVASSVAISGNTAIAAAPRDYRLGFGLGSVLVFDTCTGDQRFKLSQTKTDNGDEGDFFGWSVDIHENRIIVGTPLINIDGVSNAGAAYIFDAVSGEQLFELTATDLQPFSWFGESVAIYRNLAIVGASRIQDIGPNSGGVYVFDVSTGEQINKIIADDTAPNSLFGFSVALSGTTAIIGAVEDDETGINAGAAYIFDIETGVQTHKLMASDLEERDQFGWSVDISGTSAIVGSRLSDEGGESSGSAYVFDVITGNQIHKLVASDASAGNEFGTSVAISGSSALVGSPEHDGEGINSGSAYQFELDVDALCLADMNNDSILNFFDISTFLSAFSAQISVADFNDDCLYDFFDISAFLTAFSGGCP